MRTRPTLGPKLASPFPWFPWHPRTSGLGTRAPQALAAFPWHPRSPGIRAPQALAPAHLRPWPRSPGTRVPLAPAHLRPWPRRFKADHVRFVPSRPRQDCDSTLHTRAQRQTVHVLRCGRGALCEKWEACCTSRHCRIMVQRTTEQLSHTVWRFSCWL